MREQNSDISSTRYEAEAQITPTGSASSRERGEDFGISNAYVNVVAEENENGEEKEEEHTNEKLNVEESGKDSHGGSASVSIVEESGVDSHGVPAGVPNVEESGKNFHEEQASVSNVYINAGADADELEKQDSAL